MKTLKKKSFNVEVVAPESEAEDTAIKKIISEVKKEDKKFDKSKWQPRRLKKPE